MNVVHKSAILTDDVELGDGVIIQPYAVITGRVRIHDDSYIGAHAVIGAPAQSDGVWPAVPDLLLSGHGPNTLVEIGKGVCIREFVTVHQGLLRQTTVDDGALVMAYSHISHDSYVGPDATLSTGATLGGFSYIDNDANLGQHAVTHPWVVVGEGAMIGLNSSVIRDVGPFEKWAGAPARLLGPNAAKLEGEVPEETLGAYDAALRARDRLRAEWYAR